MTAMAKKVKSAIRDLKGKKIDLGQIGVKIREASDKAKKVVREMEEF